MNTIHRKKPPPLGLLIVAVFLLFSALSIGLTWAFGLPWHAPFPLDVGLAAGFPLLAFGFGWMAWALRSLSLRRAFGKELFRSGSNSALVTAGAYARCRNPLYFSATVLFLGWFFVLRWTPIAILTLLFFILFMFCAKWEERELTERFGKAYEHYKQQVPFLIPSRRRKPGEGGDAR